MMSSPAVIRSVWGSQSVGTLGGSEEAVGYPEKSHTADLCSSQFLLQLPLYTKTSYDLSYS